MTTPADGTPTDGRSDSSPQVEPAKTGWQFSELEYALTMTHNAYSRWMNHCMAAAGHSDFNSLDILILHNVNHHTRERRLSEIAFVLNIDDTHTVNYSVKKLVKANLVEGHKEGKEIYYRTTEEGSRVCRVYSEIREKCLVNAAEATGRDFEEFSRLALLLREISSHYDQASRMAASL